MLYQFDIFLCNFDFHIKLHCFAPKMIFLQQKGYKKANMKFSTFWPPKKLNIQNWFIRMEKIQSKWTESKSEYLYIRMFQNKPNRNGHLHQQLASKWRQKEMSNFRTCHCTSDPATSISSNSAFFSVVVPLQSNIFQLCKTCLLFVFCSYHFLQKTAFSHWSRAGLHYDHLVVRLVSCHHTENGWIHRN